MPPPARMRERAPWATGHDVTGSDRYSWRAMSSSLLRAVGRFTKRTYRGDRRMSARPSRSGSHVRIFGSTTSRGGIPRRLLTFGECRGLACGTPAGRFRWPPAMRVTQGVAGRCRMHRPGAVDRPAAARCGAVTSRCPWARRSGGMTMLPNPAGGPCPRRAAEECRTPGSPDCRVWWCSITGIPRRGRAVLFGSVHHRPLAPGCGRRARGVVRPAMLARAAGRGGAGGGRRPRRSSRRSPCERPQLPGCPWRSPQHAPSAAARTGRTAEGRRSCARS